MSLLVRSDTGRVEVTPESAGWRHVGFEAVPLEAGEEARWPLGERECCVVLLSGRADVGPFRAVGSRESPFEGPPDSVYVPPGDEVVVAAVSERCELALCFAPASERSEPRLLPGAEIEPELRGEGAFERRVHNILMVDRPAESLLVTEVLTPAGHWSSFPPHKHDRDAPPDETLLEETYYHRLRPPHGFGLMRVYSDEGSLDEGIAFGDGDVVLVPRGYHTVSAPPGYDSYYLNVMAGPRREWKVRNDPEHEWLLRRSTTS